jgi:hypothetical protein
MRRSATRLTAATVGLWLLAAPAMARAAPIAAPSAPVRAHTVAVTVVAAGDIACDPRNPAFNDGRGGPGWCRAAATEAVIAHANPDAVLALGDNQYDDGRYIAYRHSYGRSWGAERYRTYPVLGNHEYYADAHAKGYFRYFGRHAGPNRGGWYSVMLGRWRLFALNTNCDRVSCGSHSAQVEWLQQTIAAHPTACSLAIMHHPLVSSGPHGDNESGARALWKTLYAGGVDIALTGHDHLYERFAPIDAFGMKDLAYGFRAFVVGTGGAQHYGVDAVHANSQVRNSTAFGVLRLRLDQGSYAWRFLPAAGATFTDTGSGVCHGSPP